MAKTGGIAAVRAYLETGGINVSIPCAVKMLFRLWPVREHQNINARLYRSIYIASYRDYTSVHMGLTSRNT